MGLRRFEFDSFYYIHDTYINLWVGLAVWIRIQVEIKTRIDRSFTINSIRHKLVAVISIIDNGIGVNKDITNKLFLPLITNKEGGSGLGLSISQKLIQINKFKCGQK